MIVTRRTQDSIRHEYSILAQMTFDQLMSIEPQVSISLDRANGPPYYRRVDLDHQPFIYFKPKRRKRSLEIEFTKAWVVPDESSMVENTGRRTVLRVQNREQVPLAVELLRYSISQTRALRDRAQQGSK